MSRDAWQKLAPAEWKRRLKEARTEAIERLAANGLDIDAEEHIVDFILTRQTGGELVPSLVVAKALVEASIGLLGDPETTNEPGENHRLLSEQVFAYAMAAAEAGFLFGVITGAQLPWSIVEATPAPHAPPPGRTAHPKRRDRATLVAV